MRNGETPRREASSILTLEELEELLRDAPAREPARPIAGEVHVLLVSNRDDDLRALSAIVEERGVRMSVARNPFTALDYLRARDFRAVFSDFAVWLARRTLLFERIGQLDHPVDVISICDPDPREVEEARGTPALHVLERPLEPRILGEIVDRLLAGVRTPAAAEGAPAAPALPIDAGPFRSGTTATRGRGPRGDDAWYRFFFNARREIRGSPSAECWSRVLDLLLVARGGGAAAALAVDRRTDGHACLRPLCVRATLAGGGIAGGDEGTRLKGRLQHALARLRDRIGAGPLEEFESNGTVVVAFPEPHAATTVLVSVVPASATVAAIPAVFRDELVVLIGEVQGR